MTTTLLCPYCRAPTEEGEGLTPCPTCNAVHHSDCWAENGGCAILGCASGPAASGESESPAPVLPPIEESSPSMEVELDEPKRRFRLGGATMLVILGILAIGALGAVAAVVLSSGNDVAVKGGGSGAGTASASGPGESAPTEPASHGKPEPEPASSLSDAEVVAGATQVLNEHHRLLKEANMDPNSPKAQEAFELLSKRKREYEDDTSPTLSGEQYWITKRENENLRIGQAVCLPGTVTLESSSDWDPSTGVALVNADFGTYAGKTWVKYEHGHWTYDAGYAHVSSRAAIWDGSVNEPELFSYRGGSC